MLDLTIRFRAILETEEKTVYLLSYAGKAYSIIRYTDGKFRNKLYECSQELPKELEWFVHAIIERENEQEGLNVH